MSDGVSPEFVQPKPPGPLLGPALSQAMGLRMSEWLSPQQERRQKVLAP